MLAIAALTSCADLVLPGETTLSESALVFLTVQSAAPSVGAATFWVHNARETTRRLQHGDAFGTLFAEVRFPRGTLAALDGRPFGPGDSVLVTVQPYGRRYGVTVSPDGLEFAASARPRITFSYARYGDLSVADAYYAARSEYADALRLWAEISPGLWERTGTAAGSGGDVVEGTLGAGGIFGAAAPR